MPAWLASPSSIAWAFRIVLSAVAAISLYAALLTAAGDQPMARRWRRRSLAAPENSTLTLVSDPPWRRRQALEAALAALNDDLARGRDLQARLAGDPDAQVEFPHHGEIVMWAAGASAHLGATWRAAFDDAPKIGPDSTAGAAKQRIEYLLSVVAAAIRDMRAQLISHYEERRGDSRA